MFLRKGVIWKNYGRESVLYDLENDSTLTLNETSSRILKEVLVYKNESHKIAMNLQIENPECEYDELYEDVINCCNKLFATPYFTNEPENAAFVSLVGLVTALETASIEITQNCNLKCKHCYQGEHVAVQSMMSLNDARLIASKLGELGVIAVVLTGGEPFLHPDLTEIVKAFNEWNIRVVVFTNGQIVQEEIIRKLSTMNVLIRISLEGHNEETNDFIRGAGTFRKAIEFSNICKQNNVAIGYSFTVNNQNEKYFYDMLKLADEMFADEIEMSEILNINQHVDVSALLLSEKQSKDFRINTLEGFSLSKAFRKGMGLYRHKNGSEYICSAGTTNIFIDIRGNIYPCNLFADNSKYCAGNIFNEDMLEIWRKSKVFIELRNLKKDDIEGCANCPANENCKGGCRARAVLADENIKGKMEEYFCNVTRQIAADMHNNSVVYN